MIPPTAESTFTVPAHRLHRQVQELLIAAFLPAMSGPPKLTAQAISRSRFNNISPLAKFHLGVFSNPAHRPFLSF
jgi:hypothetical protein